MTTLKGGLNDVRNKDVPTDAQIAQLAKELIAEARQIDTLKIAEAITSGQPYQAGQRAVALCERLGIRANDLGAHLAQHFSAGESAYMLGVLLVTIGVSPAGRR